MKIKKMLLAVALMGLMVVPSIVLAGSFSTSFNNWNGISIIGDDPDGATIVVYGSQSFWPDNSYRKKLQTSIDPAGGSLGVRMLQSMNAYDDQFAQIEFYAPNGINNHIAIGVQTTGLPNYSPTGYFAILGYDPRLCGNPPGQPCSQLYLGIEKAVSNGNWIFSGGPANFNPNKLHRITIEALRDTANNRMIIYYYLDVYEPGYGWYCVSTNFHSDYNNICEVDGGGYQETYCNYLTGNQSFFTDVFGSPSKVIYWDKYYVEWE